MRSLLGPCWTLLGFPAFMSTLRRKSAASEPAGPEERGAPEKKRWAYFSWCVFSQMSTKQLSIISIHTFNFTYYFYARVPALFQSLWPNGSWNQWALKVLIPRLSQQRQRLNAIIARLTWLGSWMQHTKRTLILSICPPASTHQHLRCYPHPCYSCKLNFHVHQNKEPSDNL